MYHVRVSQKGPSEFETENLRSGFLFLLPNIESWNLSNWRETWGETIDKEEASQLLISSNREIIPYVSHTPWTYIASEGCSYEKSYSKIIRKMEHSCTIILSL